MFKNTKNKKIVAITTDPYDNIYGYSLVFIRLFDYIQKNYKDFEVSLISNDGVASALVDNKNFTRVHIDLRLNIFIKMVLLTFFFVKIVWNNDKNTILVANAEIPELLAVLLLKIKFKNVYCVIHDVHVKNKSLKNRAINKLRLFLMYRIKKVIFVNKYSMGYFKNKINKYYIGNPIF